MGLRPVDFSLHILIRGNIDQKKMLRKISTFKQTLKIKQHKQRPQRLSAVLPKVVINHKKI
jgi:phage tail sheath gpL-like